jgi:hypothetical protein
MCISRQKRARRLALATIRRMKCSQHRVPGCESRTCRIEIATAFYGNRKKKADKQMETSPADLDRLFYLIRNPQTIEDYFLSTADETPVVETASAPLAKSVPLSSMEVADTRRLTIRERIALGVPARA